MTRDDAIKMIKSTCRSTDVDAIIAALSESTASGATVTINPTPIMQCPTCPHRPDQRFVKPKVDVRKVLRGWPTVKRPEYGDLEGALLNAGVDVIE